MNRGLDTASNNLATARTQGRSTTNKGRDTASNNLATASNNLATARTRDRSTTNKGRDTSSRSQSSRSRIPVETTPRMAATKTVVLEGNTVVAISLPRDSAKRDPGTPWTFRSTRTARATRTNTERDSTRRRDVAVGCPHSSPVIILNNAHLL